jgi:epoxide hydrolase-like predicted phosphatase
MTAERAGRRYRALLVDYGGVMTTSVSVSFAQFCTTHGVHPDHLAKLLGAAYSGSVPEGGERNLVHAIETGEIPLEEFNRRLAELLSQGLDQPLEAAELGARLFAGSKPDPRMLEAVKAARRHGLKTGLVSNTWGPSNASEWLGDVFDAVVLSGDERVRKPQPEIYRIAAERVGVDAEACAFVDDIPANVDGARAVGMAGVLHRDAAITIPKLEQLFGFSLS